MKKIILFIFIFLTVFNINIFSTKAQEEFPLIITIDGQKVLFNELTGFPFKNEDGENIVPFRKVVEQIGAQVGWDEENSLVTAKKDNTLLEVTVGQTYIYRNGIMYEICSAAEIKNNRLYVPLDNLVKLLNCSIAEDSFYNVKIKTNDIELSNPKAENMDAGMLSSMYEKILSDSRYEKINAVLVLKNGKLVSEKYFNGKDENYRSGVFSVTKSITSILCGIAQDKGLFSIDDKVMSFFSDKEIENMDERKEKLRVKHLLNMESGFYWDETSISFDNTMAIMFASAMLGGDTLQYMLDLPMEYEPGTNFKYNTGLGHIIDGIVNKTYGKHLMGFAQDTLFNSLGIIDVEWEMDQYGTNYGGKGLHMTARDMAKIGLLVLNKGLWNDEQVVSQDWIIKSITPSTKSIKDSSENDYGYGWKKRINGIGAYGAGGQRIEIVDDKNLVIVIKAGTNILDTDTIENDIDELITDYIISACK